MDPIQLVYCALPPVAACYLLLASCSQFLSAKTWNENVQPTKRSRITIGCLMIAVLSTYIINSVYLISASLTDHELLSPRSQIMYELSSGLLWIGTFLWYSDAASHIVSYPFYGYWIMYFLAETGILVDIVTHHHQESSPVLFCRTFRFAALSLLLCATFYPRFLPARKASLDEERASLLDHEQQQGENTAPANGQAYGACNSSNLQNQPTSKTSGSNGGSCTKGSENEEQDIGGVWLMVKNFKEISPYFWPSGRIKLQLLYVGVAICLLLQRAVNVIIPLQIGLITNALATSKGAVPWKPIFVYISLRLLESSGGLPAIRRFLWMPLEDYSYHKIGTALFNHVMSLSSDFHDTKHSGKLWQRIRRGQFIKDTVNGFFFQIGPMIIDLALAVAVLYYIFDAYMALDVAAVMLLYIWSTTKLVAKQRAMRKQCNESFNNEFSSLCEATGNWYSVSYFNRVSYEKSRYASAVIAVLKSRFRVRFLHQMETTAQSILLICGLMVACFMAAYQVSNGTKPIGSFIMLLSYWAQLSGPLYTITNGLGDIARELVDVEETLELLHRKPTIFDSPTATPLNLKKGEIEFTNIDFSYDGKREILRDVNFHALGGQTTALVGQTGGGKSTILKLIFRFYDPVKGTVRIDGQDVSNITLDSLRDSIGVVPQSPTLFNTTIMTNLRYARLDATDDEIAEACKAVGLHERFLSFSDGYNTVVGERGAQLSGGELQRVAIAQAMLKNPRIVLLDEATSSVDSETEAQVQESLARLTAGRTTIVIAHRLSTILKADQIMVVNDGQIVEQGTHLELLKKHGYYHRLCRLQGYVNAAETIDDKKLDTELPHCSLMPKKLEVSWRPDAPEFVPLAQQPQNLNKPLLVLHQADTSGYSSNENGQICLTSNSSETSTDESFHIETGCQKENGRAGCVVNHINDSVLGQDAGIITWENINPDPERPWINVGGKQEVNANPICDAASATTIMQNENDLLSNNAQRKAALRRAMSKSEPVDLIGKSSGEECETHATVADRQVTSSSHATVTPSQNRNMDTALSMAKNNRRHGRNNRPRRLGYTQPNTNQARLSSEY
ncbi:hypothetical protein FQN57_000050 [Myotisia sp. PD_48]|nr:hypothetical protein FQN57_000050 [Myotisia sp. PD_48]